MTGRAATGARGPRIVVGALALPALLLLWAAPVSAQTTLRMPGLSLGQSVPAETGTTGDTEAGVPGAEAEQAQVSDGSAAPSPGPAAEGAPAATVPAEPQLTQGAGTAQMEIPSPVVTLDQDRLFTGSLYGKRVEKEYEDRAQTLSAENRRIEASLLAEEKTLTEERPKLAPEAFRKLADAFDAKVQKIRKQQTEKSQALVSEREAERQKFVQNVLPVLAALVRESGAVAILNQQAIFLSFRGIDITDRAIARIDKTIGDGSQFDDQKAPSGGSGNTGAGGTGAGGTGAGQSGAGGRLSTGGAAGDTGSGATTEPSHPDMPAVPPLSEGTGPETGGDATGGAAAGDAPTSAPADIGPGSGTQDTGGAQPPATAAPGK